MDAAREINALLRLVDDPDTEVYQSVQQRLLQYGTTVIPHLEDLWEQSVSDYVQERIELIIHRIHYTNLQIELQNWKNGDADLLHGALLVARYQYPEIQAIKTRQDIERIRRNLWLELNHLVTPIEQVKIMESILYNYYKLSCSEINYAKPDDFLLHKVVERKKGNAVILRILYLLLAEMVDIPVRAIQVPQQFLMGYVAPSALFNQEYDSTEEAAHIKFYVDPNSGVAFSHLDLKNYFSRIGIKPVAQYFKPLNNVQVIQNLLHEFSQCFQDPANRYKYDELQQLEKLLDEY